MGEEAFIPAWFSTSSNPSSLSEGMSRRPLANLNISTINLDRQLREGGSGGTLKFFSNLDISEEIGQATSTCQSVETTAFTSSRLGGSLAAAQYFGHLYEESESSSMSSLDTLSKAIFCFITAEEESRVVDPVCRRLALQGLSFCYLLRYEHMKDRSDLDKAVNICCSRPGQNNPHCNPWFHFRVADSYRSLFDRLGDRHDLEVAVEHYHIALSHPFPRKRDYLMLFKYLTLGYQTYPEFRSLLLERAREAKLAIFNSLEFDETHQLEISKLLLDLLRENFRQNKDPQILKEAIFVDREIFSIFWPIWERETFSDSGNGLWPAIRLPAIILDLPPREKIIELLWSLKTNVDISSVKLARYVDAWFDGWLRHADFVRIVLRLKIQSPHFLSVFESLRTAYPTRGFRVTMCNPQPEPEKPFVFIVSYSGMNDEILAISSNHEQVFPFVRNLTDVRDILSLPEPLPYVLEADSVWIPSIMHLLQLELDDLASQHRKACLKLLRALARKYGVLPPSLFLKNVKRQGLNAVRGGGFADIWKGEASGKVVCLKVLRMFIESDDRTRDHIISEFCHEALLWRQLNHPNVLPFLGVNTDLFAPGFCLISPWMKNGDIVTFLKNNPNHDRLDAIYQISRGLAYLHSLSPPIIHGDIRGANILVADDLRCCLADFGLALAAESQVLASTTGGLRGSVRWMAPELMDRGVIPKQQGQPRDKTPRDIYAFGCTIYEILTGKPPFSEQSMEVTVILDVIRGRRPARPTNVWCPDSVWTLMEVCWKQDPRGRSKATNIRNFLDRLCLLRKRGNEDYLILDFADDTSGPIFIDLSDDDECDLQSHAGSLEDDESNLQHENGRESPVLEPEVDSFSTDPLDELALDTVLAQGPCRKQVSESIPSRGSPRGSSDRTSSEALAANPNKFDSEQLVYDTEPVPSRPLKHALTVDGNKDNRASKRTR